MMDNERELLELAALAAGVFMSKEDLAQKFPKWEWDDDFEPYHLNNGGMSGPVIWYGPSGDIGGTKSIDWNPLQDDGDALRLAAACGIAVTPYPIYEWPKHSVVAARKSLDESRTEVVEPYGTDQAAATRKAIVRSAAEIGRSMKATPTADPAT